MSFLKEGWDIAQQDEGARDIKPDGDGIKMDGFENGRPALPFIDPIQV